MKDTFPDILCDVCGQENAVGVGASITGPVSFAYCSSCLKQKREPYGALVGGLIGCDIECLEDVAEWYLPYIHGTLEAEGKTVEEFLADIREATEEYMDAMGFSREDEAE